MSVDWFKCKTRVVEAHGIKWRHTVFGSGHEEIEADGCDAVLIEKAGERSWQITRWPTYLHRDGHARLEARTFKAVGTTPPLAKAAKMVRACQQ